MSPQQIRELGTKNWPTGPWLYNTHHHVYQVHCPKFMAFEPWVMEMTDAQFELRIKRMRDARALRNIS